MRLLPIMLFQDASLLLYASFCQTSRAPFCVQVACFVFGRKDTNKTVTILFNIATYFFTLDLFSTTLFKMASNKR